MEDWYCVSLRDLEAISSFNISLASPSRLLISIVSLLNSMDRSPLESINVTGDANEIHESIDKVSYILWIIVNLI